LDYDRKTIRTSNIAFVHRVKEGSPVENGSLQSLSSISRIL